MYILKKINFIKKTLRFFYRLNATYIKFQSYNQQFSNQIKKKKYK